MMPKDEKLREQGASDITPALSRPNVITDQTGTNFFDVVSQNPVTDTILQLKVIPCGHSSATWCYVVNASMWCLTTNVQKEWCVGFHYMNDKESHTLHW